MHCSTSRKLRKISLAILLTLGLPGVVGAGGGPENVLLVVNASSHDSLTVANHYVQLRRIPPVNVVYLEWTGSAEATDVVTFRDKILKPVLQAISDRGLKSQIDYVVYSAGFPYRIDFAADLKGQELPRGQQQTSGSITGLTYLGQQVLTEKPIYTGLTSNYYMSRASGGELPSRAFRSQDRWNEQGQRTDDAGRQYLLATMLGATTNRGNTVAEIVRYLQRSAAADGSRPAGTVYYMRNGDIRTKARKGGFEAAVQSLADLGVQAEILEGDVPQEKKDVIGLMAGVASFDWQASRSTIRPGAICEHLTSYGGILSGDPGQTPLTEFLRAGAAGSSGTVIEPYAIPHKFPHPMIHVHYARGCNLAESFYQAVYAPYQLLIVGDPLCSPWARPPTVTVDGLDPNQRIKGLVTLRPRTTGGTPTKRFELFIDGVRTASCDPDGALEMDTRAFADGYHDVRVVAIAADEIETQGRLTIPAYVDNHGRQLRFEIAPEQASSRDTVLVAAECEGAGEIHIYQNSRLLGTIAGSSGVLRVLRDQVGAGPVRLHAEAAGRESNSGVISRPLELPVSWPAEAAAVE